MSDEQLRALERGARRGDAGALLKWRLELVRLGRGVENLRVGDVTKWNSHRLKITARSRRADGSPGTRVELRCLAHNYCLGSGWANAGSKRVGVLVEPSSSIDPGPLTFVPHAIRRVFPKSTSCMCEFDTCGGSGVISCRGCGGDQCVCRCGGELPCDGCEDCRDDGDVLHEGQPDEEDRFEAESERLV